MVEKMKSEKMTCKIWLHIAMSQWNAVFKGEPNSSGAA